MKKRNSKVPSNHMRGWMRVGLPHERKWVNSRYPGKEFVSRREVQEFLREEQKSVKDGNS